MVEVSCYRVTCIRNKVIYYYVNAFNKKEAEEIIKLQFGNSVVIKSIDYWGVGILR